MSPRLLLLFPEQAPLVPMLNGVIAPIRFFKLVGAFLHHSAASSLV